MSTEELAIVILGLVGIISLAVIAYVTRVSKLQLGELGATIERLLVVLVEEADRVLEPYGEQLAPINAVIKTLEQQVDSPEDWFVQWLANKLNLSPDEVVEFLHPPLEHLEEITDGEPLPSVAAPNSGDTAEEV